MLNKFTEKNLRGRQLVYLSILNDYGHDFPFRSGMKYALIWAQQQTENSPRVTANLA